MLSVRDVRVQIGTAEVLRGIDLFMGAGETVGLVGESGSGKSMLALAVVGLLPPTARATGSVRLDDRELLGAPDTVLCNVRGRDIGFVFQEPATALDPRRNIGAQVAEAALTHRVPRAAHRAEALLARVGLAGMQARYPHELSGGQRQRAMIASALVCGPSLLLADEPTTALDSITQARVLDLLAELAAERATALLLISHDFRVVARATKNAAVMYAGRIVETGETARLLTAPQHPYTAGLLAASAAGREPPVPIPGRMPSPRDIPPGCAYAARCLRADGLCRNDPALVDGVACHHPLSC